MLMNKDRALSIMEDQGLDVLVATKTENVTYVTDLEADIPNVFQDVVTFAVLPAGEDLDPILILPTAMLPLLADRPNRVKEVRAYGYFNYVFSLDPELTGSELKVQEIIRKNCYPRSGAEELLVETIKDRGLERSRIGLDERGISSKVKARVMGSLPQAKFVDAFDLFRHVRMVKTKDEIELLRKAATINEGGIERFLSCMEEGVTEKELYREFHHYLIENGAEKGHWNSSGGTRSGALFPPSDYKLKKGDLFRFDVGCTYRNYFADTGGVYVLGQDPNERQERIYNALKAGLEMALSLIKPGVKTFEVFDGALSAVRRNGIPDYNRSHVGHGIGLEFYDFPLIRPAGDTSTVLLADAGETTLEENMTVNIELPYYELGFGGFQVEHTLVVTKTGFEFIVPYDRGFSRIA